MRPRKSNWCRVISWSVVVVSRSSWTVFFLVSRLARRGKSSSWSVVLRGQSAFFLVVVVSRCSWSSWSVDLRGPSLFVVSLLGRRVRAAAVAGRGAEKRDRRSSLMILLHIADGAGLEEGGTRDRWPESDEPVVVDRVVRGRPLNTGS